MADKIRIEDLRPAEGATKKAVRVGRGRSSGCGKTSSRGANGEGQRSGRTSKRGFEGGQMPSYRRLPKLKGFEIINQRNYAEINVGRLEALGLKEISLASLKEIKKAHPFPERKKSKKEEENKKGKKGKKNRKERGKKKKRNKKKLKKGEYTYGNDC